MIGAIGLATGAGGATRTLAASARLAPVALAAGGGALAAHRLTAAARDAVPVEDLPRREHGATLAGLLAPLPALAGAGMALAAGSRRAAGTRTVEVALRRADSGVVEQFRHDVRRGWTIGPRMLRAGSVGAAAGAAVAAGLAVPVATMAAGLVGRGTEAAVRGAMPDWLEGPASAVPRLQADAARVVVDAGRRVLVGDEPTVERFRTSVEVDPARGFDPMRDLGLDAPGATVGTRDGDTARVARDLVLERIGAAPGMAPAPVQ